MSTALTPKALVGVLVLSLGLLFGAGAAGAQVDTYEETPPPQVIDDRDEPAPQPPPDVVADEADEIPRVGGDDVASEDDEIPRVAGDEVSRQPQTIAGLPVTGGDLIGMAVLGLGAIAAGSAAVAYRRRARA